MVNESTPSRYRRGPKGPFELTLFIGPLQTNPQRAGMHSTPSALGSRRKTRADNSQWWRLSHAVVDGQVQSSSHVAPTATLTAAFARRFLEKEEVRRFLGDYAPIKWPGRVRIGAMEHCSCSQVCFMLFLVRLNAHIASRDASQGFLG